MTGQTNNLALDLHDVRKVYRGCVHALRGVSLQVHRGEVFGLLGPNGAGKSTLVKILMTVVRTKHKNGTLLGHPVGHKSTLARVGYLPEHHRIPKYLTGRQALEFYAALAGVDWRAHKERAIELLELVGMVDWADKRVASYSKGMMQRVGLAQAIMNDPDLLVLDEPTDGVDPVGRREIREILISLRKKGKTIFLNSHLLSEIEMVCDRVAILMQGKVVQQGSIDELTAQSRRYEILVEGMVPESFASDMLQIHQEGGNRSRLTVPKDDPVIVQPIIDRLRENRNTIVSVRPVRESLEDLFLRAVAESKSTGQAQVGAFLKQKTKQSPEHLETDS